jgi:hypothetical protein
MIHRRGAASVEPEGVEGAGARQGVGVDRIPRHAGGLSDT